MTPFTIAATAHSPNYLPQYLAEELGYFSDEGLSVTEIMCDPWTDALDLLFSDRADAVLGGAWLCALYYHHVRPLPIFAQINGRYPLALLTRHKPTEEFDWTSLRGKVVLVPSSGGAAAYMMFAGLLRQAGVEPSELTILRDLSHEMYADLFAGGMGDAIVTYMVNARHLVADGHAHLAVSLADVSGPIPNSVYYTLPERLQRSDAAKRFTRAIHRASVWIARSGVAGKEVQAVLAKQWPDEDRKQLGEIVKEFNTSGLWADGVRVTRAALEHWQHLLVQGGFLKSPISYEELVDSGPADFALGTEDALSLNPPNAPATIDDKTGEQTK